MGRLEPDLFPGVILSRRDLIGFSIDGLDCHFPKAGHLTDPPIRLIVRGWFLAFKRSWFETNEDLVGRASSSGVLAIVVYRRRNWEPYAPLGWFCHGDYS